jgi:hypothetical protein
MSRQVPRIDLPVGGEQIVSLAKDAAYIAIGFGVLSFQRAQVRRQELAKLVESRLEAVDKRVAGFEASLDDAVERVAAQLPDPAGEFVAQIHKTAKSARTQVRSRLRAA